MNSVKKIAMLIFVALPSVVCAGEAQVKWHDFNDYRDVRPSNQTKGSYHKRMVTRLISAPFLISLSTTMRKVKI